MNLRQIPNAFAAVALSATLIFTVHSRAFTQNGSASTAPTVSELAWMSGGWQTAPEGHAQSEEHWMRPAGGSMIGMSRTLLGGKTVTFEFLRLEQRADAIYYVASPSGRCPATDFKLTRLSGQEAIFENPQHDFPKRIIYRKSSEGLLTASIDGGEGSKSESFAFRPISK